MGVSSFGRPEPEEPVVAPAAPLSGLTAEVELQPVLDKAALSLVMQQIAAGVRQAVIAGIADGIADAAFELEHERTQNGERFGPE